MKCMIRLTKSICNEKWSWDRYQRVYLKIFFYCIIPIPLHEETETWRFSFSCKWDLLLLFLSQPIPSCVMPCVFQFLDSLSKQKFSFFYSAWLHPNFLHCPVHCFFFFLILHRRGYVFQWWRHFIWRRNADKAETVKGLGPTKLITTSMIFQRHLK